MTPWRDRCETTLRAFTEADALRFWGRGHGDQPIFDYRFEHTLAVVKLARWLCIKTNADTAVVEAAAWLHDCRKRLKEPLARDHHAQEAAQAVPGILEGTDFPPEKIPAVQHAILHHVGLRLNHRLEPLETACLWDADKLSKIGAASLVHFMGISGAFQPMTTQDTLSRGLAWIDHARGIATSMNTEPARLEARRRLRFLEHHYTQLQREWSEPMEESLS